MLPIGSVRIGMAESLVSARFNNIHQKMEATDFTHRQAALHDREIAGYEYSFVCDRVRQ